MPAETVNLIGEASNLMGGIGTMFSAAARDSTAVIKENLDNPVIQWGGGAVALIMAIGAFNFLRHPLENGVPVLKTGAKMAIGLSLALAVADVAMNWYKTGDFEQALANTGNDVTQTFNLQSAPPPPPQQDVEFKGDVPVMQTPAALSP